MGVVLGGVLGGDGGLSISGLSDSLFFGFLVLSFFALCATANRIITDIRVARVNKMVLHFSSFSSFSGGFAVVKEKVVFSVNGLPAKSLPFRSYLVFGLYCSSEGVFRT